MNCPKCKTENQSESKFCRECATPLPLGAQSRASFTRTLETTAEELARGTVFAGRYEIIEELGAGGMGRVYRAFDKQLDEEVALKLIKPEIAAEKKTVERFRNEIKIARKITHKNVCRTHDLHEEGKRLYLTMEYVRGEDLKGLIKRTRALTIGTSVALARQVAEGLGEAHKQGIVHRDLKPGNIMIDKEGQAKIMDFGIARSVHGGGITGEGAIIGTPEYMSPEQVEGKPADPRADIYALGIILFEMVTGRVPFEGETAFAIANKHKSELPPDPRTLATSVPAGLSRLILRCLEKDKAKRFQTAEELVADLAAIEAALPTNERVVSRPRTITRREVTVKFQPRKLVLPVLAVSALVVMIVFIWRPWSSLPSFTPPPKIENSIAVVSLENQTGDKANDYLCRRTLPDALIVNLENSGLFGDVPTWERMTDLLKINRKKELEFIDDDLGFELCRRLGIKALVSGSLNRAGETYNVMLRILDSESRKSLGSFKSEGGPVDSLLKIQIDELSRKICEVLGISLEKIGSKRLKIGDITTSSMEAYQLYLRGNDISEKWKPNEAIPFYQKAIQIDPNFASAYLELAARYVSSGAGPKAVGEAIAKAKELSAHAPEKERLWIEYRYAYINGEGERAEELLNAFLQKYPNDKNAHYRLAYSLTSSDPDKAAREYEKVLEFDPDFGMAYNHLGNFELNKGNFERAIEFFEKYRSVAPGSGNPLDSIGATYFVWGKLDKAVDSYREAIKIAPNLDWAYWSLAYVYALQEKYQNALELVDRLIEKNSPRGKPAWTFYLRSYLNLWTGRFDEALRDIEEEEKLEKVLGNFQGVDAEFMRGIAYLGKGDYDLSRLHFNSYWALVQKGYEAEPGDIDFLRPQISYYLGYLDLKQGQVESAKARLEEMKTGQPFPDKMGFGYMADILQFELGFLEAKIDIDRAAESFSVDPGFLAKWHYLWTILWVLQNSNFPPFVRDFMPRAYLQRGELDKAIAASERLVVFRPESKDRRLIHPLNYYKLAQLYEQKGARKKAMANYRKFLDLWKNADQGLPEVEDARKRLAGLS